MCQFRFLPIWLSIILVTGCGGGGSSASSTPGDSDAPDRATLASVSVSGRLFPAPDTRVDQTLNDAQATPGNNTACDQAQLADAEDFIYGFASATGSGGDASAERFADDANPKDFYRLALSAGDAVELEVADYHEGVRELDLYLWNSDCSRLIDTSADGGDIEQVITLTGGEHVVEVRAQAGLSRYALRVSAVWSGDYDAEELEAVAGSLPTFASDEVIIEFAPNAADNAHEALNNALARAEGLQLAFVHRHKDRATLAKIQPQGTNRPALPAPLENLQYLAPRAYEVLESLRVMDVIARQPGVARAEPNYLLQVRKSADDPREGDQWHYDNIKLAEAWDTTTGSRSDGEPVIVAILDTGVFLQHEDIQGKLVAGYDFHDGDSDPDDYNTEGADTWHGTHVAGTVAAATNNSTGVAGVSWGAQLMPVRVINDEGGTTYNVMQGVRYAAGLDNDSGTLPARPADVINLSLGGAGYSATMDDLFQQVRQKNILVVAAAGNDGTDQPSYPAAYESVVSVSATTCNDSLASYSNYGPTIALAAPGGSSSGCGLLSNGGILSTMGNGSGSSRTSAYGWLTGTSMASPHVAGVMALMRAAYPALSPAEFETLLSNGDITDDLGVEGRDDKFGHGLINAAKAVQAAQALASGGTEWSARVVAEPAVLYLGQASRGSFELRKDGDGKAPAVTGWQSNESWLALTQKEVDDYGLGTYEAVVDRSGFTDDDRGDHRAELTIALEDKSTIRLPVSIQVGQASEAAPVYVLLVQPATGEVLYETLAYWAEGNLHYSLQDVAPGDYHLHAGSDLDLDGVICQRGEICGAWPELAEKQTITVGADPVTNRDFSLDVLSRFRPITGEAVERH